MKSIKMLMFRVFQHLHLLPTAWIMRNPFKISEFFQLSAGLRLDREHLVLDLGCGKGWQTQALARRCKQVVGIDPSEAQIVAAKSWVKHSMVRSRTRFVCSTLQQAQLPRASFDRVVSFCVLEHIHDLAEVLVEIHDLLKPAGELHVSVDSLQTVQNMSLMAMHRKSHSVVEYFTEASLRCRLEEAGLEVLELFPIFTSEFARIEFERRIQDSNYGYNLVGALWKYHRLKREDRIHPGGRGIMLIARARRPPGEGRGTVPIGFSRL